MIYIPKSCARIIKKVIFVLDFAYLELSVERMR